MKVLNILEKNIQDGAKLSTMMNLVSVLNHLPGRLATDIGAA